MKFGPELVVPSCFSDYVSYFLGLFHILVQTFCEGLVRSLKRGNESYIRACCREEDCCSPEEFSYLVFGFFHPLESFLDWRCAAGLRHVSDKFWTVSLSGSLQKGAKEEDPYLKNSTGAGTMDST